jgi:hypothetical protein
MKNIIALSILLLIAGFANAQYKVKLSSKAFISVNINLETYFFVEKLAVERINDFVFDIKGTDYSHQPMVYFGFKHFKRYQNDPEIIRAAEIIKELRDTLHDNGPIMEFLLNQKEFPAKGFRFKEAGSKLDTNRVKAKQQALMMELTDSLRSLYTRAHVFQFMKANARFYKGALKEVVKDLKVSNFDNTEKWFGMKFPGYELYLSPGMPITPGEDSYRGFGPQISSAQGKIPAMIVSSSKMLKVKQKLNQYQQFGFSNPPVTKFIFSHEMIHSFVNPLIAPYASQIKADSCLYTKNLKAILTPHYINDFYVCVIEHLVRLIEIRTAVSINDDIEAEHLRKLHIYEYKCVLIPLLEVKIKEYEKDRNTYPTFKSYLPDLMAYLHSLSPQVIDDQIVKYKN